MHAKNDKIYPAYVSKYNSERNDSKQKKNGIVLQ